MPSDLPAINVSLPQDLYDAICTAAGGKQKMSAYVRNLVARELNVKIDIHHGKRKVVKDPS